MADDGARSGQILRASTRCKQELGKAPDAREATSRCRLDDLLQLILS
jgi:hypothetical protein